MEGIEDVLFKYFSVYSDLKDGERVKGVSIVEEKVVVEYANNSWEFYKKEFSYSKVINDTFEKKQQRVLIFEECEAVINTVAAKIFSRLDSDYDTINVDLFRNTINLIGKFTELDWPSFLTEEQVKERISMKEELIESAKKCGINLVREDYEYQEPSLKELAKKKSMSILDGGYLEIAEKYLKGNIPKVTDKKFRNLSIDKKVSIAYNSNLLDSVRMLKFNLIMGAMSSERIRELNPNSEKKKDKIIEQVLSNEEIAEGDIWRLIFNDGSYSEKNIEFYSRPYLLEHVNKRIQAIEIVSKKYPDKENYDRALTVYRNWQQFLSALFQYLNSSNLNEKEEASCNLFLYTREKRKEQLEVLEAYTKKYRGMDNQYREVSQKFDYFSTIETLKTGIRVLDANLDRDAKRRQEAMQDDLTLIKKARNAIDVSEKFQEHNLTGDLASCQKVLKAYDSAKDIIKTEENSHAIRGIIQVLNEQIESFEENLSSELITKIQTDKVGVPKQLLKGIGKN